MGKKDREGCLPHDIQEAKSGKRQEMAEDNVYTLRVCP